MITICSQELRTSSSDHNFDSDRCQRAGAHRVIWSITNWNSTDHPCKYLCLCFMAGNRSTSARQEQGGEEERRDGLEQNSAAVYSGWGGKRTPRLLGWMDPSMDWSRPWCAHWIPWPTTRCCVTCDLINSRRSPSTLAVFGWKYHD